MDESAVGAGERGGGQGLQVDMAMVNAASISSGGIIHSGHPFPEEIETQFPKAYPSPSLLLSYLSITHIPNP